MLNMSHHSPHNKRYLHILLAALLIDYRADNENKIKISAADEQNSPKTLSVVYLADVAIYTIVVPTGGVGADSERVNARNC